MTQVLRELGSPVVEPGAPAWRAMGVDEPTFLTDEPTHPTEFGIGMTDVLPGRVARCWS